MILYRMHGILNFFIIEAIIVFVHIQQAREAKRNEKERKYTISLSAVEITSETYTIVLPAVDKIYKYVLCKCANPLLDGNP